MNILKTVLELLKYEENKGIICADLKMMNFLLGQQGGYTNKYLCFLYLWDSRAKDKLLITEGMARKGELDNGRKECHKRTTC